jgi:hypothetical protein
MVVETFLSEGTSKTNSGSGDGQSDVDAGKQPKKARKMPSRQCLLADDKLDRMRYDR